ncbi:MAG: outer membrane beta-barrel protein [Pseudomonadaceae bacterium]|nr:outer membrane beta-barrel protein [Pseudomonadaceae bacterium]
MKTRFSTLTMMLAATVLASALHAEVLTVGQRMEHDNQPSKGLHVGGFYLSPRLTAGETYTDNVYAMPHNTKNDFITTVKPEVVAKSNWSRHSLNGLLNVERSQYLDHNDESHTNHTAAIDGRLDVMKNTYVGGGVSTQYLHEDRGDPNAVAIASKPTAYRLNTAKVGVYRGLGRFNARVDSEVKNYNYDNGYTNTGALVNNGQRDRNEWTQSLRVGYKATPGTEVFVRGDVDSRVYDHKGGAGTLNRSSHGNSVVAGVDMDISGKTKAEVFGGYMRRNFTDIGRKDITDPTYGAKVTWNPTGLTTVTGRVARTIEETTLASSSAYVNQSYDLGVEHGLTRNLLLTGGLGYANNDYKGFAANQRDDDIYSANAGLKYYVNEWLAAGLGYSFINRESNVTGGDYTRNRIMATLNGTY